MTEKEDAEEEEEEEEYRGLEGKRCGYIICRFPAFCVLTGFGGR